MEKDLAQRTKRFALAVIKFSSSLPRNREIDILMRQLIRCATSIGANYREANRGVSRAERISRTRSGLFRKKQRKTQYWLELLLESGLVNDHSAQELLQESSELLAIFASIGKKLKE